MFSPGISWPKTWCWCYISNPECRGEIVETFQCLIFQSLCIPDQSQSLTKQTVSWLLLTWKLENHKTLSLPCYPVATFFSQSSANSYSPLWDWCVFPHQFLSMCAKGFAGEQMSFLNNKAALQVVFWFPALSPEESVSTVFHNFRNHLSAKCS